MERTLRVKRIYNLGQYSNIEIMDEISGIPEEIFMDEEAVKTLNNIQLLRLEDAYFKYTQLRETFLKLSSAEEALAYIEDLSTKQFEKLENLLSSKKE